MKTRSGFVSNSSSSSFILAVGKIKDKIGLTNFLDGSGIVDYDIVCPQKGKIQIESFMDSIFKKDCDDKSEYIVINIVNNEGDEKFTDQSEDGDIDTELDYDIDSTDLPDNQHLTCDLEELGFVEDFECTYGAGRNG